ncbi:hypothetical protein ACFFX1_41045 [Dactylosporangium sucinum]|uniref:Uncharacterized protein n=1 Tax=Dactylosporangium sucinum TaxID=1424081 RepID=A0A917TAR3_9ACTN|nr:hypothetical protein [Dactylosporangium sucinum]GGM16638.1 hypothetical protein GCM10007977_017380 [Dactylosporangium sucinum]
MVHALDVLAENNFGDTRSGGLAGPMGLLIIVLLAIVTVLLIRNMTARIRRLPAEFPDQRAGDAADAGRRADFDGPGDATGGPGGAAGKPTDEDKSTSV